MWLAMYRVVVNRNANLLFFNRRCACSRFFLEAPSAYVFQTNCLAKAKRTFNEHNSLNRGISSVVIGIYDENNNIIRLSCSHRRPVSNFRLSRIPEAMRQPVRRTLRNTYTAINIGDYVSNYGNAFVCADADRH